MYHRYIHLLYVIAALVLVYASAPIWSSFQLPDTVQAASRPTVPPGPAAGQPRPTLPPKSHSEQCDDAGSSQCDEQQTADLCLALDAISDVEQSSTTYHLSVQNTGRGGASRAHIRLPFIPEIHELRDVSFSNSTAWVSSVVSNALEFEFRSVGSGEQITATILFATATSALSGTILTTRAQLIDNTAGRFSNRVTVVVRGAVRSDIETLAIDPVHGVQGTLFNVSYEGFASNEIVGVWYHHSDGTNIALDTVRADTRGVVAFTIPSTNISVGTYRVVAQGQCSHALIFNTITITGR